MRIAIIGLLLLLGGRLHAEQLGQSNQPIPPISEYGEICAKNATFTRLPRPIYPKAARDDRLSGWSIVRYEISEGKTKNIVLVKSSATIFEAPSVAATKDMEFSPDTSLTNCVVAFHFDTK